MTRVAVIDTGTNSTRLLVAAVNDGKVEEVLRRTEITRLGKGVDRTGRLDSAAKARVSECVAGYRRLIDGECVQRAVILATSSIRDAGDGEEFMQELSRQTSIKHRIIAGREEAALSFAGSTMELAAAGRVFFFDVGGGSTEIAVGRPGNPDYVKSLGMGCVRLKERYFKTDPPGMDEVEAAAGHIDTLLASAIDMGSLGEFKKAVAVAGTVTALAAVEMKLEKYDPVAIHGFVLSRESVERMLARFISMTQQERREIRTMEEGRADVIISGSLIVLRLMHYAGLNSFTVSERDILDGAAIQLAAGGL